MTPPATGQLRRPKKSTPVSVGRDRILPGWLAACVIVALLIVLLSSSPLLSPFATAGAYALVVLGLDVLLGLGGMLALGQGALWGVSAYTFALLTTQAGMATWPAAPVAIGAAVLIALVLAPLLRLRGLYFALATLVLGLIFEGLANALVDLTGGPTGIAVAGQFTVGGVTVSGLLGLCALAWAMALLGLGAVLRLRRSRFGTGLIATRDDEVAAASFGVPVLRSRILAWLFASLLTGVAGVVFALVQKYLTPEQFSLQPSILLILMLVLGGEASAYGSLIGATVITLLPNVLTSMQEYGTLIYAVAVVVVIIFLPEGLFGLGVRVSGLAHRHGLLPTRGAVTQARADDLQEPPRTTQPAVGDVFRPLVAVRGLSKHFGGITALDGVDLDVRPGEIFGIIGPNGAGKTTLLNCLSGVIPPDSGSVTFGSSRIERMPPARLARLGMSRTFQNVRLFGRSTALENTMTGGYAAGRSGLLGALIGSSAAKGDRRDGARRAGAALSLVGLSGRANDSVAVLTTGEQRLAEVARSVVGSPSLVLLDEPAAGLSSAESERLSGVIRALRERGTTVVLIEHNVEFVMSLCERILVLDLGVPIALGTPAAVRNDPVVIRAYLGEDDTS